MNLIMRFIDKILDLTVFFSFDSYGYKRHKKYFDEEALNQNIQGKVCLVTGANNGIGFYIAKKLASHGAKVFMLCRNKTKGEFAVNKLKSEGCDVTLEVVDVSDSKSIEEFISKFREKHIDILIHNAGLIPTERSFTRDGLELAFATHIFGPHLITKLLTPRLKGGRIIWVVSGGMYLIKFSFLKALGKQGKYNGVSSYAQTKRGQVILSEIWSEKLEDSNVLVSSMHPGWVRTPGLQKSLPFFSNYLEKRLRNLAEGADTIYWLAASKNKKIKTGKLWFDRKKRNKYLWLTKEHQRERDALWDFCESFFKIH
ncbi:MAG: dehydrogenase [Rhodospirillaceae bacterium]|mgnify:CR=1 FL=1|nr:dehydrogenase [Rhodospirillaceae bacterium]|tara:strand:+ start:4253 stop:5191 length:939 start_codon:yes stop_codon:yes gene_type:complete